MEAEKSPDKRTQALWTLKLQPGASKAEIEKAYKQIKIEWHPDKHLHPEDKAYAEDQFKEATAAFETLMGTESPAVVSSGYVSNPSSPLAGRQTLSPNSGYMWNLPDSTQNILEVIMNVSAKKDMK
jgi:hypothetical protein